MYLKKWINILETIEISINTFILALNYNYPNNKIYCFFFRHRVLLRFGHAENMFPLVTTLGLFYDSNGLKSNNFRENLNRKFKSGILTPFSANLAFILHKCPSNSYKVKLLINELPIDMISHAGKLECTKNSQIRSTCNIMDLKHQLSKYLNVDHDNVCELSNLKSVRSSKVVKEKNPSPSNIKNEL